MSLINRWFIRTGVLLFIVFSVPLSVGIVGFYLDWLPQHREIQRQQLQQQLSLTRRLLERVHEHVSQDLSQLAQRADLNWAASPPTVPPGIELSVSNVLLSKIIYQRIQWFEPRGRVRLAWQRQGATVQVQTLGAGSVSEAILARLTTDPSQPQLVSSPASPLQWALGLQASDGTPLGGLLLTVNAEELLGNALPSFTDMLGTALISWPLRTPPPTLDPLSSTQGVLIRDGQELVYEKWSVGDETLVLWRVIVIPIVSLPIFWWALGGGTLLMGALGTAWLLARPWERLAQQAESVSLGQTLEIPLTPNGATATEVQQLTLALDRLRLSVKKALEKADRQRL